MLRTLLFGVVAWASLFSPVSRFDAGSGSLSRYVGKSPEDLVLISTMDGGLTALSSTTGELRWSLSSDDGPLVSSSSCDAKIYVIPSLDGDLLYPSSKGLERFPVSIFKLVQLAPFQTADNTKFVGHKASQLILLNRTTGQVAQVLRSNQAYGKMDEFDSDQLVWVSKTEFSVQAFDGRTGREVWNVTLSQYGSFADGEQEEPVSHPEFAASVDGTVYAIDKEGDSLLWSRSFESTISAMYLLPGGPPSRPDVSRMRHPVKVNHFSFDSSLPKVSEEISEANKLALMEAELSVTEYLLEYYRSSGQTKTTTNIMHINQTTEGCFYAVPTRTLPRFPLAVEGPEDHYLLPSKDCGPTDEEYPNCLTGLRQVTPAFESHAMLPWGGGALPSECFCYNHSSVCHSRTGVCVNCTGHRHGRHCELCLPGYVASSPREVCEPKAATEGFAVVLVLFLGTMAGIGYLFNIRRLRARKKPSKPGVKCVGKLEIHYAEKELGKGSNGTVVLSGMLENRKVAVKCLVKRHFEEGNREIDLLIDSDAHPNVLRYHAKEEDQDFIYIALERCSATLMDVVEQPQRFGLAPPELLDLALQTLQGLCHLHRLNIVHLDLKPANILVSVESKTAKIADMGLGKKLDQHRSSFDPVNGSSGWQAPEMLQALSGTGDGTSKEIRLTKAVDVFSAGCVLYYVITGGAHPFGGVREREQNILKARPHLESGRWRPPLPSLPSFALHTSSSSASAHSHTFQTALAFTPSPIVSSLCWPEALELLSAMLHPDPRARIKAEEAEVHPLFWSSAHKLSFLVELSDVFDKQPESSILSQLLEAKAWLVLQSFQDPTEEEEKPEREKKRRASMQKKEEPETNVSKEMRQQESSVDSTGTNANVMDRPEEKAKRKKERMHHNRGKDRGKKEKLEDVVKSQEGWAKPLHHELMQDLNKYRRYNFHSVRDLLRLIRNKVHHFGELSASLQHILGSPTGGMCEYFSSRFPLLVIYCYAAVATAYFVLSPPPRTARKPHLSSVASPIPLGSHPTSNALTSATATSTTKQSPLTTTPSSPTLPEPAPSIPFRATSTSTTTTTSTNTTPTLGSSQVTLLMASSESVDSPPPALVPPPVSLLPDNSSSPPLLSPLLRALVKKYLSPLSRQRLQMLQQFACLQCAHRGWFSPPNVWIKKTTT